MHARTRRQSGVSTFRSDINATPLIDVCLVLLIVFMVITPVIHGRIPVELPDSSSAGVMSEENPVVNVTVTHDGFVALESRVIRRDMLASELRGLYAERPDRRIAVRGDKRAPYGEIADVLRVCRETGFHDVGLITETSSKP